MEIDASMLPRWLLLALLIAVSPGCGEQRRQNLVLISIDTLVADRMSAYGAERQTTPAIDRLRQRSLRFDRAYSPSSWTLPAHASMLSGRYPSRLSSQPHRMYTAAPLLSERFAAAGYRTAAVTAGLYVSDKFGFGRGFEFLREAEVGEAISWIRAHADEPFFLFFHTYLPHISYTDRRFVEPGQGGRIDEIFTSFREPMYVELCCKGMQLTPGEREFLVSLYDGGVAAADEAVGALIAALSELQLMERTTVVVTSDHGEEFWEHTGGAAVHGHSLYDEIVGIPLIWYEPDLATGGGVSDAPVSLVDLAPTFAARFGLPELGGVDGVDLSPVLEGEEWNSERPLFSENTLHGPARFSIRTQRGKLIITPKPGRQRGLGAAQPIDVRARRELYLPEDTGEERNVFGEHPELAADLIRRLRDYRAGAVVEAPAKAPEPDPELEERLRVMGYIE
jgi:arylsulfatase A-like enzyme